MKIRLHSVVKIMLVAAATAAASGASAQSAGQWTAKVGINKITPKVDSGDISAPALPHSQGDVSNDTKPIFVIGYGVTDNISAELDLGVPYKHKLYGAGAVAGTGEIGTVEAMPPTAFIQYRFFEPAAMLRPYVGLGLTYAHFGKATGSGKLTALTNPGGGTPTTFDIDNKFASSFQAGLVYNVDERWFVDAALVKTLLKTTVHFSSGQHQDITLNPLAFNIGVGYKF
jgi:outer membrane protein